MICGVGTGRRTTELALTSPMLSDDVASAKSANSDGETKASVVVSLSRRVETAVVLTLLCTAPGSEELVSPLEFPALVVGCLEVVGDV